MTKSPRKNVPDVGIELGVACMPSGHASDWATASGISSPGLYFITQYIINNPGADPPFGKNYFSFMGILVKNLEIACVLLKITPNEPQFPKSCIQTCNQPFIDQGRELWLFFKVKYHRFL